MKVTKVLYMLWVTDMDRAGGILPRRDWFIRARAVAQLVGLTLGDSTVALHQGSNDSFRMTGLSFEVDDIDEACREIEAAAGVSSIPRVTAASPVSVLPK